MILQALNDYYERKAADSEGGIAPEGFEEKNIPYIIVIDLDGDLVDVQFTGDGGLHKKGKPFLVPMWQQKSGKDSWKTTNLLWDHYGYLLGKPKSDEEKDIESARKQHLTFLSMVNKVIEKLPQCNEVMAIKRFYDSDGVKKVTEHESWKSIQAITGCNLSFKINSQVSLISQHQLIQRVAPSWNGTEFAGDQEDAKVGICLVSGEYGEIARLHRPITGVNKKPAPLLAVNNLESPAFASFNKKQGFNFPTTANSAFKYATALNNLLKPQSTQKLRVGDATAVFWSDRKSHIEDDFGAWFDEPDKDNPGRFTNKVRALLKAVDSGVLPPEDNETKFFILGLSPNAARISVRFWHVGTVAEFSRKIAQHFHDLEIVHREFAKDSMSIRAFLKAIAPLNDLDRIPPNVAGDWMRSILMGVPYPETLYHLALRKSKSHRSEKTNRLTHELDVEYPCAAIVKACLNRNNRYQTQHEKEMDVSLDKDNTNPGYRIGRLFALLEKIQEEASPGINATIRDRYYSSASGTPASVFPILLRTKNHHLGKLEKGREIYFEKLLGDVMNEIAANGFPAQLSLADQGRFAIGYYHQRQAFFTKSDKSEPNKTDQGE